jgi:hypothetical protein
LNHRGGGSTGALIESATVSIAGGDHDLHPHEHTNSAYGGYRGYSPSPFGGVTSSYYNPIPYTYMPW